MKQIIFALLCGAALTAGSFAAKAESLTEYGGEASNPSYVHISNGQYMAGGMLSIFTGWGIGHAVQGRWLEKGWIFTAGGILLNGGLFYFLYSAFDDISNVAKAATEEQAVDENSLKSEVEDSVVNLAAGVIVFSIASLGLKVWEIADAWMLPSHYKVSKSPFELSPLYSMNSQGQADFGLSLKYKF